MINDEEYYDLFSTFTECTCDHDPKDHGWICCNIRDCPCLGHWEE